MSPTIEEQIERLNKTIAEMEAQRDALGDAVAQEAIGPLLKKLNELTNLLEASKTPPSEKPAQQRKLLTILFMDIVGSTAMIQHMDPEDVSEIFDANLKRLAQPIEYQGGHVTSFMGDGFLAIFGAPTAREDDPERAVRAGLAVIQQSEEIANELEKEWNIHGFKVRVGVNTGLVILGGETEGEDTTKGPAVHLAARLQSAAPPGGLLVSHDTYRHIRGVFNVEVWEPLKVKGFDEPIRVYRILNAKPRAFRSYTRGVEGVETRMIGRSSELKYLQDAFLSAVEDGEGQLVTIMGEAGVGKSRLLYEFQNWIDLQPTRVRFYEGKAHQETQGLPLALLRDLFEFRFQLQENDPLEIVREKVETGFCEAFRAYEEGQMRAHILGQWLGFDFSTSPHLKGVLTDSEQMRNRGLMYLGEYFKELCSRGAVVVFLEDIHWADDSSLDVLNWLGERLQHQHWLCVGAARHSLLERRPFWGEGVAYHHRLVLEPLSKRESYQLVNEILKLAEVVPPELANLVVEGAEGNPFYLEELVKMLVEDGVVVKGEESWQVLPERLSEIKVPPTLAGVLQARLEILPAEEQQVLQQASVVGRLFWDQVVEHIQSVEGGKPQAVPEALGSLRNREMVYRRETSAFTDAREYLFKHDILREVTYESVLRRLRRKYHSLVADWLITQVGSRMEEFSGLIAGHLLQASRKEEAGVYFIRAGQAALASFANTEAEKYFRKALELPMDDPHKADCLAGLGAALAKGGSRSEAINILKLSTELYMDLGECDKVAKNYVALCEIIWYDDYQKAWESCQEGLTRLQGAQESSNIAELLAASGMTAHFLRRSKEEVLSLSQQAVDMADRVGDQKSKIRARMIILFTKSSDLDLDDFIDSMKEIVEFCEANCVWPRAISAYGNLALPYIDNYRSLVTSYQYSMRAIDIALNIGNINSLFFQLENHAEILIELGNLKSIDDQLYPLLNRSTARQSQVDEFIHKVHLFYLPYHGEWSKPLDFYHNLHESYRKSNQIQLIGGVNNAYTDALLEINRFGGEADLSQAEALMQENVSMKYRAYDAKFKLVTIAYRQRCIERAHVRLNELLDGSDKFPRYSLERLFVERAFAEAELARIEKNWEEALSKCQSLIDIFKTSGYRWRWARQLIDLGDCLNGRNLNGDRERAQQAFQQSLEMFTEMGATGYIQVLEERLDL